MVRLRWALAFGLVAFTPAAPADGPEDSLEKLLTPILEAHKGRAAVAVKHLKTGESFSFHADDPMPTASLIKFPVMIEAYRQVGEGKLSLDSAIQLRQTDKVPGSGVLTDHFSEGATLPLRDVIRLMIRYSDNTATNLVLDQIGIESTAETMEKLGCPNTKIHSKVYRRDTSKFPERSKQFGLGSTTANEMVRLLEALDRKGLVSATASEAMTAHLRACDDGDMFPRFLPPGTKVAFKTGAVTESRTAAGIIETPTGPVAVCVLTDKNEDHRWTPENAGTLLCAEVARRVFEHFGGKATKSE